MSDTDAPPPHPPPAPDAPSEIGSGSAKPPAITIIAPQPTRPTTTMQSSTASSSHHHRTVSMLSPAHSGKPASASAAAGRAASRLTSPHVSMHSHSRSLAVSSSHLRILTHSRSASPSVSPSHSRAPSMAGSHSVSFRASSSSSAASAAASSSPSPAPVQPANANTMHSSMPDARQLLRQKVQRRREMGARSEDGSGSSSDSLYLPPSLTLPSHSPSASISIDSLQQLGQQLAASPPPRSGRTSPQPSPLPSPRGSRMALHSHHHSNESIGSTVSYIESETVRARMIELENQLNAKEISSQILRERVSVLETSLSSANSTVATLRTSRADLELRVRNLEAQLHQSREEQERAEMKEEAARNRAEREKEARETAEREVDHLQQQVEEWRSKYQTTYRNIQEQKERNQEYVDDLTAQLAAMQSRLESSESQLHRSEERISELMSQLTSPPPSTSSSHSQSELSRALDSLSQAEERISHMQVELVEAAENADQVRRSLMEKVARRDKEIQDIKEKARAEEDRIKNAMREMEAELTRQLQGSQQQIVTLQSQLTETETSITRIKSERTAALQALEEARSNGVQSSRARVDADHALLSDMAEKLDQLMSRAASQDSDIREEVRSESAAALAAAQGSVKSLESQLSDAQMDAQRFQALYTDTLHRLGTVESKLQQSLESKGSMAGSMSALENQVDTMRRQLIDAAAERSSLNLRAEQATQQAEEAKESLKELRQQYDALAAKEQTQARQLIEAECKLANAQQTLATNEAQWSSRLADMKQDRDQRLIERLDAAMESLRADMLPKIDVTATQSSALQTRLDAISVFIEKDLPDKVYRKLVRGTTVLGNSGVIKPAAASPRAPISTPTTVRVRKTESKLRSPTGASSASASSAAAKKTHTPRAPSVVPDMEGDPTLKEREQQVMRREKEEQRWRDMEQAQAAQYTMLQQLVAAQSQPAPPPPAPAISSEETAATLSQLQAAVTAVQGDVTKLLTESDSHTTTLTTVSESINASARAQATDSAQRAETHARLLQQIESRIEQLHAADSGRIDTVASKLEAASQRTDLALQTLRTEMSESRTLHSNALTQAIERMDALTVWSREYSRQSEAAAAKAAARVQEAQSQLQEALTDTLTEQIIQAMQKQTGTVGAGIEKAIATALDKTLTAIAELPLTQSSVSTPTSSDAHAAALRSLSESINASARAQATDSAQRAETHARLLQQIESRIEQLHAADSGRIDTVASKLEAASQRTDLALQTLRTEMSESRASSLSFTTLSQLFSELSRVAALQREHDELFGMFDDQLKALASGQDAISRALEGLLQMGHMRHPSSHTTHSNVDSDLHSHTEIETQMHEMMTKLQTKIDELTELPPLPPSHHHAKTLVPMSSLAQKFAEADDNANVDELDERTLSTSATVLNNVWQQVRRMVCDGVAANTLPSGLPRPGSLADNTDESESSNSTFKLRPLTIHPQDRVQLMTTLDMLPPAMRKHVNAIMRVVEYAGDDDVSPTVHSPSHSSSSASSSSVSTLSVASSASMQVRLKPQIMLTQAVEDIQGILRRYLHRSASSSSSGSRSPFRQLMLLLFGLIFSALMAGILLPGGCGPPTRETLRAAGLLRSPEDVQESWSRHS